MALIYILRLPHSSACYLAQLAFAKLLNLCHPRASVRTLCNSQTHEQTNNMTCLPDKAGMAPSSLRHSRRCFCFLCLTFSLRRVGLS